MSLLNSIQVGRKKKPLAVLLHGVHGIGKSTFGEKANKPIFIGSEENDELDAARFPIVKTWSQFKEQLTTLLTEDHSYRTCVIDTMDSLEQVAQKEILSGTNAKKTMATAMGGFGKAYEKQREMFLDIRDNFLIPLRDNNGMNILILCHSEKTKHEDPITNTQYDTYSTSMHKKVKPIFEDWVSTILFANFELFKAERESDSKEYVIGDGARRIFTEERPSHIAKNRFGLDYEMDLDWKEFTSQVSIHYKTGKVTPSKPIKQVEEKVEAKEEPKTDTEKPVNTPDATEGMDEVQELKFQIEGMMADLDGEMLTKVNTSYKRAKDDIKKLTTVKRKLEKTLA